MKKVIHPCNVPQWDEKLHPLFCKIEFRDGKLSISGVIGPKRNGDAVGGCGQVDMEFDHKNKEDNDSRYTNPIEANSLKFADGWNKTKWYKFLDIWKHWHLNDMNSACEHQEALGWTYDTHRGKYTEYKGRDIEEKKEIIEILQTSGYGYEYQDGKYGYKFKLADDFKTLLYWNEYSGHSCPECGYEIGSAWLKREVPQDAIKFLESLPDTDVTPAWV